MNPDMPNPRLRHIPGILIALLLAGNTPVMADEAHNEFLRDFLPGSYRLIGKSIDSDRSYSGDITIAQTTEGFTITRHIGNATVQAKGRIEQATADRVAVLRMRFEEQDRPVESTCLIGSDLDNYPRLSCQLYWQNGATRQPGLEAMFINGKP